MNKAKEPAAQIKEIRVLEAVGPRMLTTVPAFGSNGVKSIEPWLHGGVVPGYMIDEKYFVPAGNVREVILA